MYEFHGREIDRDTKQIVLDRFKVKYVDDDYPERILIGNHLKVKDRTIPINEIRTLSKCCQDRLFLYHERVKKNV